jgi:hypothetical protein
VNSVTSLVKASIALLTALVLFNSGHGISAHAGTGPDMTRAGPLYGYVFVEQDSFDFWNLENKVKATGKVNWYISDDGRGIKRGQFSRGSKIQLLANGSGCIHHKITWHLRFLPDVAWPSSGWYTACGRQMSYVDLGGQGFASKYLTGVRLTIAWSQTANSPVRHESFKEMSYGRN